MALWLGVANGCIGGWLADSIAGGPKHVKVQAAYQGLAYQRVAVLAAADDRTLFHSPKAQANVCRAITTELCANVPGVQVTNPREIVAFQKDNPYWATQRPSQLIKEMNVDRLVLVDLVEYRTHEPGNSNVWQGVVTGNISVHEAGAKDPDNPSFYQTISARFPEDSRVGVVNPDANHDNIEFGMVKVFARDVVRLFRDHEIEVE